MQSLPLHPNPKQNIAPVPQVAGVYIFRNRDEILYVGKSVSLRSRIASHIESARDDAKEQAIISQSTEVLYEETDSEFLALLLESRLIQKHHPKYNVIWQDDKSYLYIVITSEEFPKIRAMRQSDIRAYRIPPGRCFGPFGSSYQVETILKTIRRVVPFCTQERVTKRACFYSKIGLCDPCPNRIRGVQNAEEKKSLTDTYRSQIRQVIHVLKGDTAMVDRQIRAELKRLITEGEYEEGIILRDRMYRFQSLIESRSFGLEKEWTRRNPTEALSSLLQLLVSHYPGMTSVSRVECYDISNLSQKDATASMVVMTDGIIDKAEYRKFKIKNPKLRSDFDMLEDVLMRRSKHDWRKPDMLLIDGGKPQVRRVRQTVARLGWDVAVAGLAKNPDRLIVGTSDLSTIRTGLHHSGFSLLRRLRDESHRFARKYHLFLRESRMMI